VGYRPRGSLLIAIAIHAIVAAAFLQALGTPRYLDWISAGGTQLEPPTERIHYVVAPPTLESVPAAAPSAEREITPAWARRLPVLASRDSVAPTRTTVDSTPVSSTRAAGPGGETDPADRGGVSIVPRYTDPRIWRAPYPYEAGGISHADALEGSLARAIKRSNDSIASAGARTERPEWVVDREGQKFGLGNDRIYLGKASIPAVALGLMPIRGFGCMPKLFFPEQPVRDSAGIVCIKLENPTLAERGERINEMSAEIRARAALTLDARAEIDRIARRKDRERAARLRSPQDATGGAPTRTGPPPPEP
jgi:hypothetical protein